MRTKSKVVRRTYRDQGWSRMSVFVMLRIWVSNALPSGNCENPIPLIHTPVDAVDLLHCAQSVFQSPVNKEGLMGMPIRSSSGITINEPDPLHARSSYHFREAALDASIDASYTTDASASTSFVANEGIAAVGGSLGSR